MSVHKKLMEARIRLQNTKLTKSGHNKFAGYTYFELGDFLPAVQQIFADLGLCGTINFFNDDEDGKGNAELRITDINPLIDKDGNIVPPTTITFVCPMAKADLKGCHDVQNLGASMTYIRRYLWVNALEIVEHDALDATTGSDKKSHIHKPTDNPAFQPDAEEIKFLQNIVDTVMSLETFPAAATYLSGQNLDNDEKTWVWDKLPSHTRSGIKKYNESLKQKEGV